MSDGLKWISMRHSAIVRKARCVVCLKDIDVGGMGRMPLKVMVNGICWNLLKKKYVAAITRKDCSDPKTIIWNSD